MSLKYRVNYPSESKGTFEDVATMHECHLVNAFRKASEGRRDVDSETLTALAREMRDKALQPEFKGGLPILRIVADVRVAGDYNAEFVKAIEKVCRKFAVTYADSKMEAVVKVASAGYVNTYVAPAPSLKDAIEGAYAKALVAATS
jgi:hypothetical protein